MKAYKLTILIFVLFASSCYAQKDGFAASTDSCSIYYRIYGSGKPLLIINGGPGLNSNGFEGLAKKLSKKYKAIIYDQRGTGKSVLSVIDTSTITMKLMTDDIENLRKHLNIKKWFVLGHSFGGMLACYYAARYPASIQKIILSSSGGVDMEIANDFGDALNSKLSKTSLDSIDYWTKKIANGDTTYHAKLQRATLLASAYLYNKKFIPVIAARLTQVDTVVSNLIWTNLQNINYNCFKELRTFNKPVLIIQGKQDIINAAIAEKEHKAFKNSKVVFINHCAHYGWLENEQVYLKELNSFLADNNN